jgi:hypothetical protein
MQSRGFPVEAIAWIDSATHSDGAWLPLSDVVNRVVVQGALRCFSAGYVLHEDETTLTISHSWSPDEQGRPDRVADALTIPKVSIVSRERLADTSG